MSEGNLTVLKREETGKQAAKRIRREGGVPGVLYGIGIEPTSLSVDQKELLVLLHTLGRNAVVNLTIGKGKKKIKSFIYDIQHDPISGDITHIDLKQISMDEKIHVTIPVHLTGTSTGVKNEGGIVEHMLHSVDVMSLPSNIPEAITIDITDLHLGAAVHVKEIGHEQFDFITDPESVIVHIVAPRVVKADTEGAEEGLLAGLEGPAQPEVIGERKREEE